MKETPLSILEFGYIDPPNLFAHQVINSLFEEISIYDSIGYKRFWLSEHYSREFAWYTPEILLPLLAGYSNNIILGIAGVLLSYHSPLRVAHNFRMLSAIYAGRIDLGLARAFVPDHISRFLTRDYEEPSVAWAYKIEELFAFLNTHESEKSLIKPLIIPPQGTTLPATWFLGSSEYSIENAIKYKSNFCLSFMHPGSNYEKNKDVIKRFKEKYFATHDEIPVTAVLVGSAFQSGGEELKRFNAVYDGATVKNPIGSTELIIEQLHKIRKETVNDEFVLFCPVADRERRKDFFQTIISKWKVA